MTTKLRKRSEGFTIIEVLIVLAIAGLIMLIVFLAVPALQRNSRNTQRGNDASRALGAAQEVLSNNNNSLASVTSAALQTAMGTPAYYTATNITVAAGGGLTAGTNGTTVDTMVLYTGAKCLNAQQAIAGTTRQLAVVWTAEAAVQRCQDS